MRFGHCKVRHPCFKGGHFCYTENLFFYHNGKQRTGDHRWGVPPPTYSKSWFSGRFVMAIPMNNCEGDGDGGRSSLFTASSSQSQLTSDPWATNSSPFLQNLSFAIYKFWIQFIFHTWPFETKFNSADTGLCLTIKTIYSNNLCTYTYEWVPNQKLEYIRGLWSRLCLHFYWPLCNMYA